MDPVKDEKSFQEVLVLAGEHKKDISTYPLHYEVLSNGKHYYYSRLNVIFP